MGDHPNKEVIPEKAEMSGKAWSQVVVRVKKRNPKVQEVVDAKLAALWKRNKVIGHNDITVLHKY